MAVLTREAILNCDDRIYQLVDVPEWGGQVRIRSLTGIERDQFESSLIKEQGKERKLVLENVRGRLVSLTAVDEKGGRLFQEADLIKLGEKNGAALDRLYQVAQKLSGIGQSEIDELTKNSEAPTGAAGSSALPEN